MAALLSALVMLPLVFASGAGNEILQPLAISVLDGLINSTAMSSLNCQRIASQEGNCELTRVYFIWKNPQRWQLSDIQSIEVINRGQQLRLQTIDGKIQLISYYASLGRTAVTHQELRVNQMTKFFINDQESVLAIREDMRVVNVPVSVALIVLDLEALLDAQRRASKSNT